MPCRRCGREDPGGGCRRPASARRRRVPAGRSPREARPRGRTRHWRRPGCSRPGAAAPGSSRGRGRTPRSRCWGTTAPTAMNRRVERARAAPLATKPRSCAARITASRLSARTPAEPLSTRETVAVETPARSGHVPRHRAARRRLEDLTRPVQHGNSTLPRRPRAHARRTSALDRQYIDTPARRWLSESAFKNRCRPATLPGPDGHQGGADGDVRPAGFRRGSAGARGPPTVGAGRSRGPRHRRPAGHRHKFQAQRRGHALTGSATCWRWTISSGTPGGCCRR